MVKSLLFAQMCDSNFGGMHSKRSPTLQNMIFSEICKKICKIIVPQNKNSQISHNCLVLKYVDTKKCRYEVQNYESGQDEDCPRV